MQKGHHLLVDCRNVARELCSNDALFLDVMARAASRAGMHVISQIRYKFGQDSAPGFTAIVMLDESHVSAHTYADLGLVAMDVFTCGSTDPRKILKYIQRELDLGDVTVTEMARFTTPEPEELAESRQLASVAVG